MATPTKIIIFFHALLRLGDPPELLPGAIDIIPRQMKQLQDTGLLDAASEFIVGINDEGFEGEALARILFPSKAKFVFHGLKSRCECRTILLLENWVKQHPGEYLIFYAHSKGVSHPVGSQPALFRERWRNCMSHHCVLNWRQCVHDLESGFESVGAHWMEPPATPPGQFIWAGNFFWSRASFLSTLPSIMLRDRIKVSGIDALESRYEAEVWLGNGPRLPRIRDYHGPNWTPCKIATCFA